MRATAGAIRSDLGIWMSLLPAGAAALAAAWLVVHYPAWFSLSGIGSASGVAVLAAGLILAALFLRFPVFAACTLAALVYLNLSEVLVRNFDVPSILQLSFVPLALAAWLTAWRGR
jgi:hypothetical protein